MGKNNCLHLVEEDQEATTGRDEPEFANCQICNIEGEIGSCEHSLIFLHQIDPVEKIEKKLRDKINLPADYTHYLVGGFGSFLFDWCVAFFTARQAAFLPHLICDNCISQLLAEEKYLIHDQMRAMQEKQENGEAELVFSFENISRCDQCGRGKQEATQFCLGNELFYVQQADLLARKYNKIPIEFDKYIRSSKRIFFHADHSEFHILFQPGELAGYENHICEFCLRQKFVGKELPYTEHFEPKGVYTLKVS
ncbi:MAG: hypothetical protein NTX82_06660 [Candidatus Parcubacteria bacterium]|nr:hypothetical protein [Candidatus Parcubacteria bacterium]